MKFKAKCLYLGGQVATPEQLALMPSFIGTLWLLVEDDPQNGSSLLEARLIDAANVDLLPPLSDVKILYGEDGMMLVRGHAQDTESRQRCRQSWYLLPITEN